MRKRCLLGLLLAVVSVCAAGAVAAAPKGKIVIGMSGEPPTLDPHTLTEYTLSQTLPLVFDTLLFRDPAGKTIPRLATSYRLVKPTVWEFRIRRGVKFTNGEPVDAHAVKFSLERIMDPKLKSQQYAYFRSIVRVEVVDPYTVWVHTKYPDMFLTSPLSQYGIIVPPKYYQSQSRAHLARNPVGSGPYRLVRWKKGEEFVYEANPNYWQPGVPRIKAAVVNFIPEPTSRVSALLAGDVDFIESVPPSLVPMVKANPKYEVLSGRGIRTCYINMIIRPGTPWADVRVRQAVNYAVDVDSILEHVLQGYAKRVATNVGPSSYGHDPGLKPYPYDPARARRLLAEAGHPNGFAADLDVPVGRYLGGKEVAEAMAGHLEKVGVKVLVRPVEWGFWVKHLQGRWEPRVKPFWSFTCRADQFLHAEAMFAGHIHSRSTWGGFRDKSVDQLIDEARSETDDALREERYRRINRVIYEKAALLFLYQQDQIHAKSKRVDWRLRADDGFFIHEMGLKE